MKRSRRSRPPVQAPSAFAGFRFPPEVILLAVRWYLRYGLSYRDLEALLAERGITVDHVTLFRWVQRLIPELIDAARPCRRQVGDRWFVDETYVKVAGVWRYVYRAVDQHGQVIDVYVSARRDIEAAKRFFETSLTAHGAPVEVITDKATALARVIDELIPKAFHNTGQYENNSCEADLGRLKSRLRPMRGLKTDRTASVMIRGHAFIQNPASVVIRGHALVQNVRRGHYELGVEAPPAFRLATAFDELQLAISLISPAPTFAHTKCSPNATPPVERGGAVKVVSLGFRATAAVFVAAGLGLAMPLPASPVGRPTTSMRSFRSWDTKRPAAKGFSRISTPGR